jgi:hypothetical protein
MEQFWEEYKSPTRSFSYDDQVIHIIATGHNKGNELLYIVVHDDAHHLDTGVTQVLTSGVIEEKFGIDLLQI